MIRWYLAALAPTAAVNIAGLPCPLTVWEKDLLRAAGKTPYEGGFISQYFVKPFYAPGLDSRADPVLLAMMTVWCVIWLSYAAWAHHRSRVATA